MAKRLSPHGVAGVSAVAEWTGLAEFDPIPSVQQSATVAITVAAARIPTGADCLGIPVGTEGDAPRQLGVDRPTLTASGFEGKVGQTLVLPRMDGPTLVAIGIGDPAKLDAAGVRDAAAAFARAAGRHTHLAMTLPDGANPPPDVAAQAVVEGVLLANYRYDALKQTAVGIPLAELAVVGPSQRQSAFTTGVAQGRALARATLLARDLGNGPPRHLTASRMAEVAADLAAERRLDIEVFDEKALAELGCGGLLGVNRGSVEPPRMIKLTYQPAQAGKAAGHLTLVGKGVMYDSGGISLKPSDAVHATMKTDMSGAGAVLAAMSALAELECPNLVTAYLMCTDNMPSGSAMALGDVLTIHGGKTVEVMNTDAEGRLVMADALVLATEEQPDAIVSIATLTGAALRALGTGMAAVLGNDQPLVDQVTAAAGRTGEAVWQLPLERRYRKELDSNIADLKNIGGPNAGTITATLFLEEFVNGLPYAHIDIAGTANVDADDSWRSRGATGFGARLLIDLAQNFAPTRAST